MQTESLPIAGPEHAPDGLAPADAVTPAELAEVGLFGGLDEATLDSLARDLEVRACAPGSVVFHEGDAGHDMFVVRRGEIEICKRARVGREVRVALVGPRDWFGEMSLLDVQARAATARAIAPSELLVLTSAALAALYRRDVRAYALVALNLAREMSRRLRVADAMFADLAAAGAEGAKRDG